MMQKAKPWKEISRETLLKKYGRGIDNVVFELPDGRQEDFYIKNEDDVAVAIVVTKDKQIILARQFRPGPGRFLSDLPGGYIEGSDSPESTIEREVLEETGYEGKVHLLSNSPAGAYSTRTKHCFVITDCEKVAEPQNDEDEFVEVVSVSLDKFREMLRGGQCCIDISVGYLALDYLGLL